RRTDHDQRESCHDDHHSPCHRRSPFHSTVGQSASAPSAISSANPSASATARAIPDRETLPAQEIRGSSRDAYQTPVGQDGLRVTPLTEALLRTLVGRLLTEGLVVERATVRLLILLRFRRSNLDVTLEIVR